MTQRTKGDDLVPFVNDSTTPMATVYTDDAKAYFSLLNPHFTVRHSAKEFVKWLQGQDVHTNGIESFWSMLKRAQTGTFHKPSPKHLNRYVKEFAAKHNIRELDTLAQMRDTVIRMVGRNLFYTDLIVDNGLDSGARS